MTEEVTHPNLTSGGEEGSAQSQPGYDGESAASANAEPSGAKRLGYDAEKRILAYLHDGDADTHDSLHSDVQRLYQEMLTWRILCQRWTPGGSEFTDPAYCAEFIQRERRASFLDKIELARLRASTASPESGQLGLKTNQEDLALLLSQSQEENRRLREGLNLAIAAFERITRRSSTHAADYEEALSAIWDIAALARQDAADRFRRALLSSPSDKPNGS